MSYQTIATKYRPKTFKDLVGQESVSLALMGSIAQKRVPSGVIFSGTRGVGKTSLARIYAKALNCEDNLSPEPCGKCSSCTAISEGHHEDVVEIDGASNNGVDEVRTLRESTVYVPQRSRYRIYIIDEVHMLSISAFNALLKTLEEPPSHVVFLFATTELEKLPQTVVSRCQVFRLQKISLNGIADRVNLILKEEGISWEDGLLPLLAREGRGSLRDALTFLDQLIAVSGSHLTKNSLEKILGELSEQVYLCLLEAILKKDASSLLTQIASFDDRADSFVRVVNHLAMLTRHCFVFQSLQVSDLKSGFADLEEEDLIFLERLAKTYKTQDLNRLFRKLSSCLDDLRDSFLDRYMLENLCLEWCLEGDQQAVAEVSSTVVRKPLKIEPQIKVKPEPSLANETFDSEIPAALSHSASSDARMAEPNIEPEGKEISPEAKIVEFKKPSFPSSWKELVARWKEIKPLQARKLEEVVPHEYSEKRIVLLVDEGSLVGPTLLKDETRKKVAIVLSKLFNFSGDLVVRSESQPTKVSQNESLLDEKKRFQVNRDQETRKTLHEHELTKGLCEKFKGQIVETVVDLTS